MAVDYRTTYNNTGFLSCVDVLDEMETRRLKENFEDLEKKAGSQFEILCF